MREQLADFRAVGAEFLERMLRPEADERFALKLRELLAFGEAFGHRLVVHLGQLGFGIKSFKLRRAAGHGEPDDALGALREWEFCNCAARGSGGGRAIEAEKGAEGDGTEAGGVGEEGAAGQVGVWTQFHDRFWGVGWLWVAPSEPRPHGHTIVI